MSIATPYLAGATLVIASATLMWAHHAGDRSGYARGHAEAVKVRGSWDAERASQSNLALAASQEQRRIEQQRASVAQGITDALESKLKHAQVNAAANHADSVSLRDQLAAVSAAASSSASGDIPAAGQRNAERVRILSGLLSESSGLVEEGRGLIERIDAKLTALQEHEISLKKE